jgi:hypothetical protein
MKITICAKKLILTELLLHIVSTLYVKKSSARLLHADIEAEEEAYDSSNKELNVKGKFTVGVTDAVTVELGFWASYRRNTHPQMDKGLKTWRLNTCTVIEPESGDTLNMIIHEGKPVMWDTRDKKVEFLFLIKAR